MNGCQSLEGVRGRQLQQPFKGVYLYYQVSDQKNVTYKDSYHVDEDGVCAQKYIKCGTTCVPVNKVLNKFDKCPITGLELRDAKESE